MAQTDKEEFVYLLIRVIDKIFVAKCGGCPFLGCASKAYMYDLINPIIKIIMKE